jgi:hypothetical protein
MRTATVLLLLTIVLASPVFSEESAADLPFHLPTPEGWLTETIPFPLGFAPDVDYQGFEELRFAPGWRQAESEEMWAYTFVWWIPEDTSLSEERLEKDLSAYYEGLMVAVAQGKDFDLSDAKFVAELAPPLASDDQETYLLGTVETFDSFVTAEMISLNVKICQVSCEEQGMTALFFELSPQPFEHEVWAEMDAIRQGFRCTP